MSGDTLAAYYVQLYKRENLLMEMELRKGEPASFPEKEKSEEKQLPGILSGGQPVYSMELLQVGCGVVFDVVIRTFSKTQEIETMRSEPSSPHPSSYLLRMPLPPPKRARRRLRSLRR
jgi:hypothetical protein